MSFIKPGDKIGKWTNINSPANASAAKNLHSDRTKKISKIRQLPHNMSPSLRLEKAKRSAINFSKSSSY